MSYRNAKQFLKLLGLVWPFIFFAIWISILIFYIQRTLDNHMQSLSLLPTKESFDKSPIIVLKEELIGFHSDNVIELKTFGIFESSEIRFFDAVEVREMGADKWTYITYLPIHSEVYIEGNNRSGNVEIPKSEVQRYFELIRTITGRCRKIVRVGGELNCKKSGDENWMDGHKLICLNPEFQIGNNNQRDCLVMSFGVNTDTSFDEGISDLNCDVHMFDLGNYTKEYFRKDTHMYFHQIGLDVDRFRSYNLKSNVTSDFDNLNNIILNLGLQKKLINVLKIDIEGSEYKVIHDIISKPYLNIVGQIAMEVHAMDLLKLSDEERIKKAQYWIRAIEALESRGFRRVAYWDNVQPNYIFVDSDGKKFETAGEMLLINYNWYNETFRSEARKWGYNFVSY